MAVEPGLPTQFGSKLNMWAMLRSLVFNNVGVLVTSGAPTNGTSGTYAGKAGPGTLLVDIASATWYINTNTLLSPTWVALVNSAAGSVGTTQLADLGVTTGKLANAAVTSAKLDPSIIQRATGTILSADITGTGAGQLGHAQGVVLQAAPGANVALQLIAFGLYYTFATAAYTAGGNLTVNWGAGGAALTGLVSAANSLGAASSKALMFFPLTTAAVPIVSNQSLNLVSSVAFTQPGTAAGTVAWELWYRNMAVGF